MIYTVIRAPRKEWRNRLPIYLWQVEATSSKDALAKMSFYKEEFYNKPVAVQLNQVTAYVIGDEVGGVYL